MKYDTEQIKARVSCADVLRAHGVEWQGRDIRCPLPGHDDNKPSFGLFDDAAAFKCHGCGRKGDAIELETMLDSGDRGKAIETLAELAGVEPETGRPRRTVATYDYTDSGGKLLFQVCRYDPKDFRQRRPDPGNPGGWIWKMEGVERVLFRLPEIKQAIEAGNTIYIAEGEKAVGALVSLGLDATCSPGGALKWKQNHADALTGASVVIIPDNDEKGRQHAAAVLVSLHGKAESARVVELPELPNKGDAADWVAAGGTAEKLAEIVASAPEWTPPTEATDRRALTSPDNGAKGGRPSFNLAELAEDFARDKITMPNGYLVARHYRDGWQRFADGWHGVSDCEMEKTVMAYLQDHQDAAKLARQHYARNVLANLASFNLCGILATVEKPCWLSTGEDARNWIAFSNGIAVDVWSYAEQIATGKTPTGYTRTVTPDLFSADFVSYPWDESAIPVRFVDYLSRVQPDLQSFDAVRWMMGLLLADTGKFEVFWQLYGRGANGKTVLLDIVEALVGRRNICRVPLESLAPGTRFQSFPLAYCKANVCGELATDLGRTAYAAIEGQLKHAVSGGTIEIERKGIDKEEARCRARFVMAGNSLPTFFDKSDAIWRRLRIIPFDVQIPEHERDADLAQKIIAEELPAIATWALDGLAEVIRMGRVPDCPAGAAMKEAHRASCDHERAFIADGYEQGTDADRIKSADLYAEYKDWMSANGYRALGAAKFAARVAEIFPAAIHKPMKIEGLTARAWAGIRRKVTEVTLPI